MRLGGYKVESEDVSQPCGSGAVSPTEVTELHQMGRECIQNPS